MGHPRASQGDATRARATVILEIDHLLVAAADAESAAADLGASLGLEPAGGGVHESIGTRNALLNLGGPYLEVIGLKDGAPETRAMALRHPIGAAVVRALDSLTVRGGGPDTRRGRPSASAGPLACAYVTVALRSDGIEADLARLRAAGRADMVVPSEVVRRRPDGTLIRWPVAFPPRLGPDEPPFLIEHAPDEPERTARLAAGGVELATISVVVADPGETAGRWLDAWGITAVEAPGSDGSTVLGRWRMGSNSLAVGPHRVDFVPPDPTGPSAIVRLVDRAGGPLRPAVRGPVVFEVSGSTDWGRT